MLPPGRLDACKASVENRILTPAGNGAFTDVVARSQDSRAVTAGDDFGVNGLVRASVRRRTAWQRLRMKHSAARP
jgi:hypothetical protein